jgi:Phospholipid methyltransferase
MLLRIFGHRGGRRTQARQASDDRAPTAANLAAFTLLLLSSLIFPGTREGYPALLLASLGSVLAFVGAAVVLRSRVVLGPAWSLVPKADQETGLITTGPYRLVRHPIYFGFILVAAGEALAFSSSQSDVSGSPAKLLRAGSLSTRDLPRPSRLSAPAPMRFPALKLSGGLELFSIISLDLTQCRSRTHADVVLARRPRTGSERRRHFRLDRRRSGLSPCYG